MLISSVMLAAAMWTGQYLNPAYIDQCRPASFPPASTAYRCQYAGKQSALCVAVDDGSLRCSMLYVF